ncbi:fumarate hydratase class I, aerobic [Lachnospiraceae bacterium KM106-2]|nr:fumarate hydratase class I, aerobic [Lachnospiraceae bacterium KM106-2]
MEYYIDCPLSKEISNQLAAGDTVFLSGVIYTARDAAHKRIYEAIIENRQIPIELKDNTIYYLGPSPAREGMIIGSAGPTTSSRMDKYTPLLIKKGLLGMIGKGKRSKEVIDAIIENQAIYFAAIGGAGALLSKCITSSEVIAYDDLGTEAIRKLEVKNLPVIVVIDSKGNNLYDSEMIKYRKNIE